METSIIPHNLFEQIRLAYKPFSQTFTILLLLAFISCEESIVDPDPPKLDPSSSTIIGALPNSNPVGYPVLISGTGFTDSTQLFFDGTEAVIEARSDTFLTTIVPTGAAGTGVTISAQNPGEEAFDFEDQFDVLSSYPNDIPLSPPSIIFPSNINNRINAFTGNEENWLFINVYDPSHMFSLYRQFGGSLPPDPNYSFEFISDTVDLFYFDEQIGVLDFKMQGGGNFDAGIEVDKFIFPPITDLYIERSNNWSSDTYTGEFFRIEDFTFPVPWIFADEVYFTTDMFLLLTSKGSENFGRQFLFVAACYQYGGGCD